MVLVVCPWVSGLVSYPSGSFLESVLLRQCIRVADVGYGKGADTDPPSTPVGPKFLSIFCVFGAGRKGGGATLFPNSLAYDQGDARSLSHIGIQHGGCFGHRWEPSRILCFRIPTRFSNFQEYINVVQMLILIWILCIFSKL